MKKYVFKPYSKIFPELFQKEKGRISKSLSQALAIEHIGSTAVPNLGGKGIIDIAIAVQTAAAHEARIAAEKALAQTIAAAAKQTAKVIANRGWRLAGATLVGTVIGGGVGGAVGLGIELLATSDEAH